MVDTPPPPRSDNPVGGGFIIAILVMLGAVGGSLAGQTSIGMLGGLALGCLISLMLFLRRK